MLSYASVTSSSPGFCLDVMISAELSFQFRSSVVQLLLKRLAALIVLITDTCYTDDKALPPTHTHLLPPPLLSLSDPLSLSLVVQLLC